MIPDHTLRDLNDYRDYGKPPGGFLRRVLENRPLFDVVGHADASHAQALKPICIWIYNELPLEAWGSKDNVSKWTVKGGNGRPHLNVLKGGSQ